MHSHTCLYLVQYNSKHKKPHFYRLTSDRTTFWSLQMEIFPHFLHFQYIQLAFSLEFPFDCWELTDIAQRGSQSNRLPTHEITAYIMCSLISHNMFKWNGSLTLAKCNFFDRLGFLFVFKGLTFLGFLFVFKGLTFLGFLFVFKGLTFLGFLFVFKGPTRNVTIARHHSVMSKYCFHSFSINAEPLSQVS